MDGTQIWIAEEADGYGGEMRRDERGSNWDSCAAWGVSSQITHLTHTPSTPLLSQPQIIKRAPESQMLAIRIGVTIAQISFCGQNIECTSPQRHTHWNRKEEDYELIWQNGCIFHTWIERLCDRPASALGFVDIIRFSTGSPNSQQPLHLCPHTQGLLNGCHLTGGIWSSSGQYKVAYVWPPHRSREGSTPGPCRIGPGP